MTTTHEIVDDYGAVVEIDEPVPFSFALADDLDDESAQLIAEAACLLELFTQMKRSDTLTSFTVHRDGMYTIYGRSYIRRGHLLEAIA